MFVTINTLSPYFSQGFVARRHRGLMYFEFIDGLSNPFPGRKLMRNLVVVMLLALFCQAGGVALAQTQFGTISGHVVDPSDAIVADAAIRLTNTISGLSQTSTSNDAGVYLLPNISIGEYEITVEVPGFEKYIHTFKMTVAERKLIDVQLKIGFLNEELYVKATASLNRTTGDLSTAMDNQNIQLMPLLDRNPYRLISLVPAVADTGASAGDTGGIGISVAGTRTQAINFMLDGGENNETFTTVVAQSVPQDAIAEFRILTNSMTAEFGRNPVVANVVTKSGGNDFHGSLYEFYRGSGLSAWNYDDKANGTSKSRFVRNQFGASLGGPVKKDTSFFFGSFEGNIVRSNTSKYFYVPTQEFINASAPNAQEFIQGFGEVLAGDPDHVITAGQIVDEIDVLMMQFGMDQLIDYNTGQPIAADTPLFSRLTMKDPRDTGGGDSQNTYLVTGRFDHIFNSDTHFFGRVAYQQSSYPLGSISISPYTAFNTGRNQRYQNHNLTLTHNISPNMFSETRVVFNRINESQPLGEAPQNTPCWDYYWDTPESPIVFPGYLPESCAAFAIPAGAAQNVYQFYEGMMYSRGSHTMKWGGQYIHIRDNRTFGAGQSAWYPVLTMQGMVNGIVDAMQIAFDTKGKSPGDLYSPDSDGPFSAPNSTRHHRYNEFALYFEDSIRINRRLNLTLGLRWEYFGVLHSPDHEKSLDSNLYLNAADSPDPDADIYEQVRDARFSQSDNLYNRDFTNFAPRFGFAYDLSGNGNTMLRGGYGIYYNRNFGNALFNVMLNFPNYSIYQAELYGSLGGPQIPIAINQYDSLNALFSGGALPLEGSARMLNREMKTAYSTQWNLTLEHNLLGKGIIGSLSYIGTNGYHLYSLNNLNQLGSCLLAPDINPTCNPAGGNDSRLNQTGLTSMNRRGNEGLSRYHAMTMEVRAPRIGATGINIKGNYTWAHLIDNASSSLGLTAFEGRYGFGFRDPYQPSLDRASSTNDVRHRSSISGLWTLPFAGDDTGFGKQMFNGWTLSGIFKAQTGTAFSVYDVSLSQCLVGMANFCYPVVIGDVPEMTETAGDEPNSFILYDNLDSVFESQASYCSGDMECTANLSNLQASLLSSRNLFRTPGLWNFDIAIVKEFSLPKEGVKLRFNVDLLNVFNHANLYALPGTNQVGVPGSRIEARRGKDPNDRKEQRNIQLALRLLF